MTCSLASIRVHPIKSLGGFEVDEARLTPRGLERDRRWMLVDGNGLFLSQRSVATMACLHCSPHASGFRVTDVRNDAHIDLPWELEDGSPVAVEVWEDRLNALEAPVAWSDWFSEHLGLTTRLVYMPDSATRPTDATYAIGETSFSDGFPYLIISQASLDDLNARMAKAASPDGPIGMERFRPNLVIAGGAPFQEDGWKELMIGDARFSLVKPCARCVITTTDQRTGERGKEPLRTLATFRLRANSAEHKVDFGMNAMMLSGDMVRVGDLVSP